jgi:ribonuclease I
MANLFKIDPNNYLGFQHEQWRNMMYAKALSHPDEYFDIRQKALSAIRDDACSKFYETIYSALTTGKKLNNEEIHGLFKPCIPNNEANQLAINYAATVRDLCDEAFEKVMPADFKNLANKRLADSSASGGL